MSRPIYLPLDNQDGALHVDHIYSVLGVARRSTGYEINYINSNAHGRTNKWARYKPEAIGGPAPLAFTQRKDNNFGLVPAATYDSVFAFRTAVANNTFNGSWNYVAPGANHYMRLSDWLNVEKNTSGAYVVKGGYNHEATKPFGTLRSLTATLSNNTNSSLLIPCEAPAMSDGSDDGQLNIADFTKAGYDLSNWYFGVMLYYNANKRVIATTSQPIGKEQDWQVDMGYLDPATYAGSPKAVPFMSSVRIVAGGAEPSGARIVGVDSVGATITLKTTSQLYVANANCHYPDNTRNTIRYRVDINNTAPTAVTLQNVYLRIATSASGANEAVLRSFGSIKIEAGQTWQAEATVNNPNRNFDYQFCKLSYTYSGGSGGTDWINFEDIDQC